MKYDKIFAVIISAILLICLAACQNTASEEITEKHTSAQSASEKSQNSESSFTTNKIIDTTEPKSTDFADNDSGGLGEEYSSLYDDYKYRSIYYSIAAPFVDLVDEDTYWDWLKNETPYRKFPMGDVNEMAMVAFIKRFNISREDFDKANKKHKEILLEYGGIAIMNPAADDPYYDRNIECKEVYNADIIYTFDNELINSYYLYVDPYAEEASAEQ